MNSQEHSLVDVDAATAGPLSSPSANLSDILSSPYSTTRSVSESPSDLIKSPIQSLENSVADTMEGNPKAATKGYSSQEASGPWTPEEQRKFLEGLKLYGNQWNLVQKHIGTRSCIQIRSHAQKYFKTLRIQALRELKRNKKPAIFVVTREYRNLNHIIHKKPFEIDLDICLDTRSGSGKATKRSAPETTITSSVAAAIIDQSITPQLPQWEEYENYKYMELELEPISSFEPAADTPFLMLGMGTAEYNNASEEGEKSPEIKGFLSSVKYEE